MAPATEPSDQILPMLLGSRQNNPRRPASCIDIDCQQDTLQLEVPEPAPPPAQPPSFRVRNTFIDTSERRSPSLDAFYREREVTTCPGRSVGRLRGLFQDDAAAAAWAAEQGQLPLGSGAIGGCDILTCAVDVEAVPQPLCSVGPWPPTGRGDPWAQYRASGELGGLLLNPFPSSLDDPAGPGAPSSPPRHPPPPPPLSEGSPPRTLRLADALREPVGCFSETPDGSESFFDSMQPYHALGLNQYAYGPPHAAHLQVGRPGDAFFDGMQPYAHSGVPVQGAGFAMSFGGAEATGAAHMGMAQQPASHVERLTFCGSREVSYLHGMTDGMVQGVDCMGDSSSFIIPQVPSYHADTRSLLGAPPPAPPMEPAPGSPELPSVGSAGHSVGRCKPCAFVHTGGCENGLSCQFCHLCDAGEKKRRRKAKLECRRAAHKMRQAHGGA